MSNSRNSVVDFIRRDSLECLNEDANQPFKNALFQSNVEVYASSQEDHELLARFSFVQPVNIDGISFKLAERDVSEGFGPRRVKLFANATPYDMSDAESESCTQEIEISNAQLLSGEAVDLRLVRFKNVNFLQIYVSENHGKETTRIGRVNIYGSKGDYVDITKWKPHREQQQ
ncbi:thioredoxin-like protein [Cryptosporidium ryanae]|uniref:thioredoxin-like protein n=1 Tax=Cryptosporidium ryanae TaxID=515981 RepID=UPI00351A7AB2|nr:thioredoxin-like protein [Cryptosporidium ryanae]